MVTSTISSTADLGLEFRPSPRLIAYRLAMHALRAVLLALFHVVGGIPASFSGTLRDCVCLKDRLERTGMSWTRPGAQAMLNLRAICTCDQWDDFDKYRINLETQRLYPYRQALETIEWPIAA